MCFVCMYVCIQCSYLVPKEVEVVVKSPEVTDELQYRCYKGNRTQVLWKSSQSFLTTEPSFHSPALYCYNCSCHGPPYVAQDEFQLLVLVPLPPES